MDSKQAFLYAYQKEYKKTKGLLLGITIVGICFLICAKIIHTVYRLDDRYIYVFLGFSCFIVLLFEICRNIKSYKNVNKIITKYKEDWNIDFALSVFETLLENKCRLDYLEVLQGYLDLLFRIGRFDMFEKVYQKNRNIMKLPFMKKTLGIFIIKCLSLTEDRSIYKKQLFKHRFTRWHKVKGELSEIRKQKRFQDESFEVFQLYEAGEYRKAIERIEQMHIDNPWDQLRFQAEKEKCLYHLGEQYNVPKEEDLIFLFVRQWKTVVETGKEYTYEHANRMLSTMKRDSKSIFGIVVIGFLSFVLSFSVTLLFSLTLNEKAVLKNYVKDIETWEIEVSEVRGFCENNDMAAAVIYAELLENEEPKKYYLASVDYFTEDFVPMMSLDIQRIDDVTGTNVYVTEGDYSTYVAVVTEKPSEIIYDGKLIEDAKKSRLSSSSLSNAPYLYSFMIEEEYDEDLLKVQIAE